MDNSRRAYHAELAGIRAAVLELSASVTEAVPRATSILLDVDLEGADYLISDDARIDAVATDIERRCIEVLRLQAPVAVDLRQIVAAMRIVAEIERSADLLVNICKAARRLAGHPVDDELRWLILSMGRQAQQLHLAAIEAFIDNDAAKAAAIDDMDNYLDALQKQFVQAIFESHSAGNIDLQVAVQLAVVARFYERIGDHAVNIGERVRYVVTGWMPEHKGAARYRAGTDDTGRTVRPPMADESDATSADGSRDSADHDHDHDHGSV